ncbi:MAG: hypothetical protein FJ088_12390 [Deltaproteobacteria bacterium]|nr:hypothetical protein [Deltaproteobacteria bacterium]
MKRALFFLFPVVLAGIVGAACNMKKMIANNMVGTLEDISASFNAEKSVRHAREAVPAMLKQLDGFILSSPNNRILILKGAEMNCGFAFLLIEEEDPEWASILYKKGIDYTGVILKKREGYEKARKGPLDGFESHLMDYTKEDVPLLLWAGACIGSYVNLNRDDIEAVAEIPYAIAMIKRVIDLDERYYNGAAHTFLGVLYGSFSKALGGNPELSREHFEKMFGITNNQFLLGKVLYAATYAVITQNKGLFVETLNGVITAEKWEKEEYNLVNAVAKIRAEKLLGMQDEKFLDE